MGAILRTHANATPRPVESAGRNGLSKRESSHHTEPRLRLGISNPGDAWEREADRAADFALAWKTPRSTSATPMLMRAAADNTALTNAPKSIHEITNRSGSPLEPGVRRFFEPHFGHDFSHVRVHCGSAADHSADEVNARAYTVGRHIVFGHGEYQPATPAGRALIAHELAHTIQQDASRPIVQRKLRVLGNQTGSGGAQEETATPANDLAKSLPDDKRFKMMDKVINTLCKDFNVGGDGKVNPISDKDALKDKSIARAGLQILASVASDWKIELSSTVGSHTAPGQKLVYLQPSNSPIDYSSWSGKDKLNFPDKDKSMAITAGHELVGHAALSEAGGQPEKGDSIRLDTDVHEPTIRIENEIASEQGVSNDDLRGLPGDPSLKHRAESVGRVVISNYDFNGINMPKAEVPKVEQAARFIKFNNTFVDIVGHTDNQGTNDEKTKVSNLRAHVMKQDLISMGVTVTVDRLGREFPGYPQMAALPRFGTVKGVGDSQPPKPAGSDGDKRRVEIFMPRWPAGMQNPPAGTPGNKEKIEPPEEGKKFINEYKEDKATSLDKCKKLLLETAYPDQFKKKKSGTKTTP